MAVAHIEHAKPRLPVASSGPRERTPEDAEIDPARAKIIAAVAKAMAGVLW